MANVFDKYNFGTQGNNYNNRPRKQEETGYLDALMRGGKANLQGVAGGLGHLFGAEQFAQDMQRNAQQNARKREHDTVFSLDYITDPEGLAYDVGGNLGSMVALAPFAMAVPAGVATAGAGAIGAGLGRLGLSKGAQWALSEAGKKALATGIRGAGAGVGESLAEWGSTAQEAQAQGAENPRLDTMGVFGQNLLVNPISSGLEYMLLGGKLFNPTAKAGETFATRALKAPMRALPAGGANAIQNGIEEVTQQTISDNALGLPVGDIYNPSTWTDSQRQAFEVGFASGGALAGISSTGRALMPDVAGEKALKEQRAQEEAKQEAIAEQNKNIDEYIDELDNPKRDYTNEYLADLENKQGQQVYIPKRTEKPVAEQGLGELPKQSAVTATDEVRDKIRNMPALSNAQLIDEIQKTNDAVYSKALLSEAKKRGLNVGAGFNFQKSANIVPMSTIRQEQGEKQRQQTSSVTHDADNLLLQATMEQPKMQKPQRGLSIVNRGEVGSVNQEQKEYAEPPTTEGKYLRNYEQELVNKYIGNPQLFEKDYFSAQNAVKRAFKNGDLTKEEAETNLNNLRGLYDRTAQAIRNNGVIRQTGIKKPRNIKNIISEARQKQKNEMGKIAKAVNDVKLRNRLESGVKTQIQVPYYIQNAVKEVQEIKKAKADEQRKQQVFDEMKQGATEYINSIEPEAKQEVINASLEEAKAGRKELFTPLVNQLKEGMGQGVTRQYTDKETGEVVDVSDLKGKEETKNNSASYNREVYSNNAPWYQNWFKSNGRKPNNAELYEIAENIYLGNDEYGSHLLDGIENDEEALSQNKANVEYFDNLIKIYEEMGAKNTAEATTKQEEATTETPSKTAQEAPQQEQKAEPKEVVEAEEKEPVNWTPPTYEVEDTLLAEPMPTSVSDGELANLKNEFEDGFAKAVGQFVLDTRGIFKNNEYRHHYVHRDDLGRLNNNQKVRMIFVSKTEDGNFVVHATEMHIAKDRQTFETTLDYNTKALKDWQAVEAEVNEIGKVDLNQPPIWKAKWLNGGTPINRLETQLTKALPKTPLKESPKQLSDKVKRMAEMDLVKGDTIVPIQFGKKWANNKYLLQFGSKNADEAFDILSGNSILIDDIETGASEDLDLLAKHGFTLQERNQNQENVSNAKEEASKELPKLEQQLKDLTNKANSNVASEMTLPNQTGITFNLNSEKNGIEIKFNKKPSDDVLKAIKGGGYRWSSKQQLWWASQNNEKAMKLAKALGFNANNDVELDNDTNKGGNQDVIHNAEELSGNDNGSRRNQDDVRGTAESERTSGNDGQGSGTTGATGERNNGDNGVSRSGDFVSGERTADKGKNEEPATVKTAPRSADRGRSLDDSETRQSDVEQRGTETIIESVADRQVNATQEQLKENTVPNEKAGRKQKIAKSMPFLTTLQVNNTEFAHVRLNDKKEQGVMFTDGTGTGKTFSGLAIIQEALKEGKKNILIVSPSNTINNQWVKSAKDFFVDGDNKPINIHELKDVKDGGKGVCITTYANIRANEAIVNKEWDLVVCDEAHNLMSNEKGNATTELNKVRMITYHNRGLYERASLLVPDTEKLQQLRQERKALGEKLENAKSYDERKQIAQQIEAKAKEVREESSKISDERNKLIDEWKQIPKAEKPKVIFLTATPFAYDKDIDYAEGYLFDYPEVESGGYNQPNGYQKFMIDHFGYHMSYNKLTRPDAEVDNRVMEVNFHNWLRKNGALEGHELEVDYDYNRGFILVGQGVGAKIDEGFEFLNNNRTKYSQLIDALDQQFDARKRQYLLESIKAQQSIKLIKDYLKAGKKVVVFHDTIQAREMENPFIVTDDLLGFLPPDLRRKVKSEYEMLRAERPDLFKLPMKNLKSPLEIIDNAFGKDAMYFNGKVSKKQRELNKAHFNNDNSGKNLIIVQKDAGNAGISLHDTTGKHQRVAIFLGTPTRPTYAIQMEGRIYRTGNKSNAIFRYLTTGTNMENYIFATTIAGRASTAENLAMGDKARGLRDSFINAYAEVLDGTWEKNLPNMEGEDIGGKEADRSIQNEISEFERAKSFYYANQKKNSKTKEAEGVDYYATPEPVGFKMVEWAGLKAGDKVLEPSAGHGAISRFFDANTENTIIEPSGKLASVAVMNTDNAKLIQSTFESHNVINKYDAVIMNPPFGTAGKTAMEHVAKAFKHLRNNGRLIALVPRGKMDERFDKWYESEEAKHAYKVAEIELPAVTFKRAGTSVGTRILIIDKHETKEPLAGIYGKHIDLRSADNINELFDRIENIEIPAREQYTYDGRNFGVIGERKYSPLDNPAYQRSLEEIYDDLNDIFEGAKVEELGNEEWRVTTPNGKRIIVKVADRIILNDKQSANMRKAHNLDSDYIAEASGYWRAIGENDVDGELVISRNSKKGTAYHEILHAVMDLALTTKEKQALIKDAMKEAKATGKDVEEVIAERYRKWVLARKKGQGTAFGKLFKKMQDFYYKLKKLFTGMENAHNIMRKIESGEVWERNGNANIKTSSQKYSEAPTKNNLNSIVVSTEPSSLSKTIKEQGIKGWLQEKAKNFYRDWVDKNDALRDYDNAIEKATGRKLTDGEKIYNKAQMMNATATGMTNALIEGDEQHIKSLSKRLGRELHNVTLKKILDFINNDKMNKLFPNYLKENGYKDWVDAFGHYLAFRRLREMVKYKRELFNEEHAKWVEGGKKGKEPVYEPYKLPEGVTIQDIEKAIQNAPAPFKKASDDYYKLNDNMLIILEDAGIISKEVHKLLNDKYKEYCPLMRDFSDTAGADMFLQGLSNGGRGIANVSSTLKRISLEGSERGVINPLETTFKAVAVMANRAERNKVGQLAVSYAKLQGMEDIIRHIPTPKGGNAVADPKNSIFTVMIDGKKEAYQVIPELYSPIVGYNVPTAGFVLGVARDTARMLRTGATISPSFVIRNFIRDTIFASISSQNGFIPIVDSVKGAYALLHDAELKADFEVAGVTAFNFYKNAETAYKSLVELNGGKEINFYNPIDVIKALAKYPEEFSAFVESATRMGEFKRAREAGKSIDEATRDARELTIDFSRSGVLGENVNLVVPFFNATIQGGDKLYRLFRDNPVGTAVNVAKYIVLPSMVLWAMNYDDEEYKELDPKIKMTHWIIGDVRIPKPQEAGVLFGSGIEAMLDLAMGNDPEAMKHWAKQVVDGVSPNIIPTVILPIIEWQANYSFFRDGKLVGYREERLPDELQYKDSTSELSKDLGKLTGLSPIKLDNTVRGYTGTMGMLLWQAYDIGSMDKAKLPEKKITELPLVRDFFVNDYNARRSVDDFYKLAEQADKQHAGYGVKGKPTAVVQGIRRAKQQISNINKDIRNITASNLTPSEKRERIDKKREIMHRIAKQANNRYGKFFE